MFQPSYQNQPSFKERAQEFFLKFSISVAGLIGCLFPFWIYLAFQYTLSPQGFWQHFVLVGVAVWLLGGFQVILLIVWLAFMFKLWLDY